MNGPPLLPIFLVRVKKQLTTNPARSNPAYRASAGADFPGDDDEHLPCRSRPGFEKAGRQLGHRITGRADEGSNNERSFITWPTSSRLARKIVAGSGGNLRDSISSRKQRYMERRRTVESAIGARWRELVIYSQIETAKTRKQMKSSALIPSDVSTYSKSAVLAPFSCIPRGRARAGSPATRRLPLRETSM